MGADMADDELDLDELHQAVNQIMTNKKPRRSSPPPTTPSPAVAPKPAEKPLDSDTFKVEVKRPVPPLSVPQRRRGNAMDIISNVGSPPPSPRPSRTGLDIQPARPVVPEPPQLTATPPRQMAPKPAEPTDEMLASLDMKDEPVNPKPAPTTAKPDADAWPDPLDYHGFKEDTDKPEPLLSPPHEELLAEHTTKPAEEPAPTMTDERPEGSPFISAKVEKRPLGAYTKEESAPEPQPTSAAQPKELSPEVVAVETDPHMHEEPEDINTARQMAISPQYQAADKQPSQSDRPVFDTKEYHPPIDSAAKAPPKHSSLAMIIILGVLVLVAAVVAYMWMTGMLDLSKFV